MQNIIIEQTDNSPQIILNAEEGIMEIEGKSYPENTFNFYKPILEWLEDYFAEYDKELTVNFKLNYFNSATTQVIYEILDLIQENRHKVKAIRWFYDEDNESAFEDYQDYAEEFPNLKIQAIALQGA